MSSGKEKTESDPSTERIAADEELHKTRIITIDTASASEFDDPPQERLFDQYTIYSKIGSGGMGVVYLARDRRLGRFVAIKRLNHKAQGIKSLRQRFLHEARAVAALSHVHIIHIYALGEDDDGPFIVMEYIAGPDCVSVEAEVQSGGLVQPNKPYTLEQYIRDQGQLSVDSAIEMLIKIARAVSYAHSSGVIHRDLKPSNILLDKSMEPKIVDFGLARLATSEAPQITVPGEKLLSIGYGAPEQEKDASLSDERADVYGLGALLYFVITGQNPRYFREQDLPVGVREVVVKATATEKENRWTSALEFADELQKIANRTKVETPTVKTTWRCKWCDAVNPMTIKYCAECGWDGSEKCPECGMDSYFGVQYCNNCGADARAYETVLALVRKMRDHAESHRYENVLSFAGRTHGFEPAGPSGRELLKEISDLRLQANKAIQKRQQLKEQIPIEIRAENFERARRFIEQYREISEDHLAFESEYSRVPEQILQRDLVRMRKAMQAREWDLASRICDELENVVGRTNRDVAKYRGKIKLHYRFADIRFGLMVVTTIFVIYLLSLPIVISLKKQNFGALPRTFYAFGAWSYESSLLSGPLTKYAALWIGDRSIASYFVKLDDEDEHALSIEKPDELLVKQSEYQSRITELYDHQREFRLAWPGEYRRELELLLERFQRVGDFQNWEIVQRELTRFEREGGVTDTEVLEPDALAILLTKYRNILYDNQLRHNRNLVKETKLYVNALREMQTKFMQDGNIVFASAINNEIIKVNQSPKYIEAQNFVDNSDTTRRSENDLLPEVLLSSTAGVRVEEVTEMRSAFREELDKAAALHAERISAWPEQYLNVLRQLRGEYQQAGDYEGWEDVTSEMDRFEVDLDITPEQLLLYQPRLMAVQNEFRLKKDKIKSDYSANIVRITDDYLNKLQEMMRRLTVEGKMDKASEVNTEIKRVRAMTDYAEALKTMMMQGPPEPDSDAPKGLTPAPATDAGSQSAPAVVPTESKSEQQNDNATPPTVKQP